MPEEAFVNDELGIIEVKSYGVVRGEELSLVLDKIQKLAEEAGIHRVLVDASEEKQLPSTLIADGFGSTFPNDLKFAVVIADGQPTAQRSKHICNVAYLNGANIQTFARREDALRWLTDSSTDARQPYLNRKPFNRRMRPDAGGGDEGE